MKKVDLVIFGGQSNMQGQTETLSEAEAVAGAFEYKLVANDFVPLKNPVGEDIRRDATAGVPYTQEIKLSTWWQEHLLGSACYGHTNLVPSFCRAYVEKSARSVIAVHAAKGSTRIDEWLPNTDSYQMLVKKSAAAIKKAHEEFELEHIYFVWLQGESDAIAANSKAYYKEKLSVLFSALSNELSVERFCIIRVGRFTNDERDNEIIDAQSEICREDENFVMLTEIATELNTNPVMMNPYVEGHYSAKGLEVLGTTAGATLAEYVCKN